MSVTSAEQPRLRSISTGILMILGFLIQLLLVALGALYIFVGETELEDTGHLLLWCGLALVYLIFEVCWAYFGLMLYDDDPRLLRRVSSSMPIRVFSTLVSLSASLVGLSAATTMILTRGEPDHLELSELIAVVAMLLSWALFQLSYARIYYSSYYRAKGAEPLRFPGTEHPRFVDFIYFALTNGTSFAASDVAVMTSRMRWTVAGHTTSSFFFNALIIVLTMNTITGGLQGS